MNIFFTCGDGKSESIRYALNVFPACVVHVAAVRYEGRAGGKSPRYQVQRRLVCYSVPRERVRCMADGTSESIFFPCCHSDGVNCVPHD